MLYKRLYDKPHYKFFITLSLSITRFKDIFLKNVLESDIATYCDLISFYKVNDLNV